jgi:hypothetical protein
VPIVLGEGSLFNKVKVMCDNCSNKGYNGWNNYETWVVALWLSNDEGSYNYWKELAEEAYKKAEEDTYLTKVENAVNELSDLIKDYLQGLNPLTETCDLYSDLISAAISEVDTHEIAKNWIDDIKKEE